MRGGFSRSDKVVSSFISEDLNMTWDPKKTNMHKKVTIYDSNDVPNYVSKYEIYINIFIYYHIIPNDF